MGEMKSLTLNDKKYDGFVDPVARALASAAAVIQSASGESITLSDSSENKLFGLNIYGKTTQNGTPSPDAPVEMVSVGDSGSITVNVNGESESQSMTLAMPNGLLGIPVYSGGNYTDASGQQWVCDEIDLARGVYVRRVEQKVFDGSSDENWAVYQHTERGGYCRYEVDMAVGTRQNGYCDRFQIHTANTQNDGVGVYLGVDNKTIYVHSATGIASDINSWIAFLSTHPITIQYILETPVETTLSAEEIAAYNALRTYRDNTTITNDGVAYMELEYAMDAKEYIDSIAVPVARLSEVTLLASAWVGANSPYSQVITLDGITEYSKVDLLPSVEQLSIFHHKDLAFVTENEDGVVTVYSIGDKPANDYTMQVQITEVEV